MGNPFDAFDPPAANPFDAFDAPADDGGGGQPLRITVRPRSTEPTSFGSGGPSMGQIMGEDSTPMLGPGQMPARVPMPFENQNDLQAVQPRGYAVGRGALQGASMGFADELVGAAYGAGSVLTGGQFGPAYDQTRDQSRVANERAQAEFPYAYGAAKIGGGIAATLPVMAAAPGLFGLAAAPAALARLAPNAVGATAGAVLPRMTMAGVSGIGLGGAQGFGEGQGAATEQLWNAGAGAVTGGGVGFVAPGLGAAAGATLPYLASLGRSAVPGLSGPARRDLVAAYEAAGPAQVQQTLGRLGPDAMMLDAGQPFLGRAQGIAAQPGAGGQRIVSSLEGRDAGTYGRIGSEVDAAFGPAPIPSQISRGIDEAQAALGPDYGRVMSGAVAADTSPLAGRLEAGIINSRGDAQRAMRQVRGDLDIPGNPGTLDPNPQALLATRQAIDGRLRTEADPNTIRVLTQARQEVDAELARAVPGIKDVDAYYAELARQDRGLARGSQVMDSGKTAVRPQELALELQAGVQPEGTLIGPSASTFRLQQGVRGDLDRVLGTNVNDLASLRSYVKGEGDWNRAKLAQVFGSEQADRVIGSIDRETAFRDAFVKVAQGSQTAQRLGGAQATGVRSVAPSASDMSIPIAGAAAGPGGAALAAAGNVGRRGWNALGRSSDEARNLELAKFLILQGDARDEGVKALGNAVAARGQGKAISPYADRVAQVLLEGTERNTEPVKARTRLLVKALLEHR